MDFPSTAVLYSLPTDMESHRLRFLAAERHSEITFRHPDQLPTNIRELLPTCTFPCLVEKSIIVYGPEVLEDYLLEKYLGAHLLTLDPHTRAKIRMLSNDIRSWYNLPYESIKAQLHIFDSVLPTTSKWFSGNQFTMVDIAIAPLLWFYRDTLATTFTNRLNSYTTRLFARPAYIRALPPTNWFPAMEGAL